MCAGLPLGVTASDTYMLLLDIVLVFLLLLNISELRLEIVPMRPASVCHRRTQGSPESQPTGLANRLLQAFRRRALSYVVGALDSWLVPQVPE